MNKRSDMFLCNLRIRERLNFNTFGLFFCGKLLSNFGNFAATLACGVMKSNSSPKAITWPWKLQEKFLPLVDAKFFNKYFKK